MKRIPALPDLPTVAEQGWTGFKIVNSYNLFAPACYALTRDFSETLA
jgi:tripartite-type tricarboxylate transporter receptor subunit TctC